MAEPRSELTVITKTKDLCTYIMTVTQKSPKHFRFTFVTRLQNLALDALESIIRANDVFVKKGDNPAYRERAHFQQNAMTSLKLVSYIAEISMEAGCLLPKQFEQVARQTAECEVLLGGWMAGDRNRFFRSENASGK